MSVHFINLSNGLAHAHQVSSPHFLRIQSTWCEQKRWGDVLATVGPDFLYHLATADGLTIHDQSERDRMTRALWQGLPWVRYAVARAWGYDPKPAVLSRRTINATAYFDAQYRELDRRLIKHVAYFGKYADGRLAATSPCVCARAVAA